MQVSSLDVPDVGESHPHKNASDGFVQKGDRLSDLSSENYCNEPQRALRNHIV